MPLKRKYLYAAAAICLLSACASNTTATNSSKPAFEEKPTVNTSHSGSKYADLPEISEPAQIKSGQSKAIAQGFTDSNNILMPDIQEYAQELSQKRNIPQAEVNKLLKAARYNDKVASLMSPSKTRIRRSWVTYKKRFVEPIRIKAGTEFWQSHRSELADVEKEYGVPAEIIVAIIGVETIYGRYMGDFKVLDALATLGFRYPDPNRPERSKLFRDQLADLILLHHQGRLNAYEVTGSYAGAMGLPQFMPGSLLRYAVDGNNDGNIDLHNNTKDAITSVASFLRHHGWQPGLPVFAPVSPPNNAKSLVTGDINPDLDWQTLEQHGARILRGPKQQDWMRYKVGVVDLLDEPRQTVEYRIGTPNFFAITHYNRSYFYAASVYELAQEIKQRVNGESAN